MPSSKDNSKPRKVIDITEPGKSEPSATSRAIIVTNRPMLQQDPMVIGTATSDVDSDNTPAGKVQKPESELSSVQEGHSILPPSAPHLSEDSSEADQSPTVEVDSIPKSDEPSDPQPPNEAAEKPEIKVSDAVTDKKVELKSAEIAAPSVEKEPTEEPVAEAEPKDASSEPEEGDAKSASGADDDQVAPNKVMDEATKKAAEEKAAKEAELEKLIESKKYFLPINAIQLRRNKLQSILLFSILIILVLALLDFSLDAGLLKINGVHSLTHFFSS
jgi:hypothetical protein